MIKILFTINYFTNGGPSNVIKNIMCTLDKKKYDVTLMTFTTGNNPDCINNLKKQKINVIECNIQRSYIKTFANMKRIQKMIQELNPDVIHASGVYNGLIVANTKILATKVYTVHSNLFEDLKNTYGVIKGKMMLYIQLAFFKKYDYVVGCSKSVFESLQNRCKNLYYVNNGICFTNDDKAGIGKKIRDELGIPQEALVYIFCGHLNVHKRIVELVEMMKNSMKNDEYFIILGDGIYYEKLLSESNNQIKVLGFKTNVSDYLSASNIYISNSDTEGFSIAVIEALSHGLCLLLSDIKSHSDVFKIDKNVYLGETYNKDFYEKKEKLYKNYKTIDQKSIQNFQKKYLSNESMTQGYEKFYLSNINKKEMR